MNSCKLSGSEHIHYLLERKEKSQVIFPDHIIKMVDFKLKNVLQKWKEKSLVIFPKEIENYLNEVGIEYKKIKEDELINLIDQNY